MSAFHRVPAGTKLYRGCMLFKGIGTTEITYFSPVKAVARQYGRCLVEIETLKDIDLLDLSTKAAWDLIQSVDWGDDKDLIEFYTGTRSFSYQEDFIDTALQSPFFNPDKVYREECEKEPGVQYLREFKDCVSMDWHGIRWGPKKGQFKRSSLYQVDMPFVNKLREKCTDEHPELCIAGIYAPYLPSPSSSAMSPDGKIYPKVFTEEFAFFGLPEDSFKRVEAGGKRKKTRRVRSKKSKRTRKHG